MQRRVIPSAELSLSHFSSSEGTFWKDLHGSQSMQKFINTNTDANMSGEM